jgi:hypothetical protein
VTRWPLRGWPVRCPVHSSALHRALLDNPESAEPVPPHVAGPDPSGGQGLQANELRWVVHPAGDNPAQAFALAAIMAVAAVLCWRVSGSVVLSSLGLVFLGASLRSFFLPRSYRLDTNGASESGPLCTPRTLSWESVRRVSPGPLGLHLSLLHSSSRLVPDRGLFLRAPRRQQQVADFVARHVSLI